LGYLTELFNCTASFSKTIINDEFKRIWNETLATCLKFLPLNLPVGARENNKNLNHDSLSPDQGSNLGKGKVVPVLFLTEHWRRIGGMEV
jgi:hypothetical protein